MKRILHLASWYPNRVEEQAGDFIQRHLQAISRFMPVELLFVGKDQNQVQKITREKRSSAAFNETLVYYKPRRTGFTLADRLISTAMYTRVFKKEIRKYIRENGKPDLVHVHVAMRAGILALWLKKTFHIPFIITEHWSGYYRSDPDNFFNRGAGFRLLTKRILSGADHITTVSTDLLEQLKNIIPIKSSSVIYNVVDTDLFFFRNQSSAVNQFIHISNLHPIKNVQAIIRALARVKETRDDWFLSVVGSEDPACKKLAVEMGIDGKISWTKQIDHDQVPGHLQKASWLLMFSHHENLSCVVCEALCSGLPVVSSRVGGLPEILNEENSILILPGDEDALVAAILRAMDLRDHFNKQKIAAAAASKFNPQSIGSQFVTIYDEVGASIRK